jgi:hypothetical protein
MADIVGTSCSCVLIALSNASTVKPAGFRGDLGRASDSIGARTVFREIPDVLAIVLMPNPSRRCSQRISARPPQTTTPFAPLDSSESRVWSNGVRFSRRFKISFQPSPTEIRSISTDGSEMSTGAPFSCLTNRQNSSSANLSRSDLT